MLKKDNPNIPVEGYPPTGSARILRIVPIGVGLIHVLPQPKHASPPNLSLEGDWQQNTKPAQE